MDIAWYRNRTIAVLSALEGEDAAVSTELSDALSSLRNAGTTRIVVNLSRVDFITSGTLGCLCAGYRELMDSHGELVFSHVPLGITRVFHACGLEAAFRVFQDDEAAVRHLGRHDPDGPDGPGGAGHPAPLLPRRPTGSAEASRPYPPPPES